MNANRIGQDTTGHNKEMLDLDILNIGVMLFAFIKLYFIKIFVPSSQKLLANSVFISQHTV